MINGVKTVMKNSRHQWLINTVVYLKSAQHTFTANVMKTFLYLSSSQQERIFDSVFILTRPV